MGDGWSGLEVIIVLILVIALLGRVFGTGTGSKKVPDVATYKTEQKVTPPPAFNDCGKILVASPKPNQRVSVTATGISVQATIKNCDTIAVAPGMFSYVVVDAYGTVVSDVQAAPISMSQDMITLSGPVMFMQTPRTGTGYLIITRVSNTDIQLSEAGARIPIRFVN